MSTDVSNSSSAVCGACQCENDAASTFCAGCGHALREQCFGCGKDVLLTQKFCAGCGADLDASLRKRLENNQACLNDAVRLAKSSEFSEANALLHRVAKQTDFRFAKQRTQAAKITAQVAKLQSQVGDSSKKILAASEIAFDERDFGRVCQLLKRVPKALMDDEARARLKSSEEHVTQTAFLRKELKQVCAEKDWTAAGGICGQLLQLDEHDTAIQTAAKQITDRLEQLSRGRLAKQKYAKAIGAINAIPTACVQESTRQLRSEIEHRLWLSKQFDNQPLATSTLGRLAMRFVKDAPEDTIAKAALQELSTKTKQKPDAPRGRLPSLHRMRSTWTGGNVNHFAFPSAMSFDEEVRSELKRCPGSFAVAMGLGLQGLQLQGVGKTMITDQLIAKKGKLKSLIKRRKSACWGIDLGTSGLRAVRVEFNKGDERPRITEVHQVTYTQPNCRLGGGDGQTGDDQKTDEESALKDFVETHSLDDCEIWCNMHGKDAITRFLQLPPVKDSQADQLLDDEVRLKIPVSEDELSVIRRHAPAMPGTTGGRPAMVIAAKRSTVDRRIEQLKHFGLNLNGLQVTPIALANFVAYEFADVLADENVDPSDKEETSKYTKEPSEWPMITAIDAGTESTTAIHVSQHTFWYTMIEQGGEDITTSVSKSACVTKSEAETLKRNPAKLSNPGETFEPIENKLDQLRSRLQKSSEELLREIDILDPKGTWCFGAASHLHNWLRVVVSEPNPKNH